MEYFITMVVIVLIVGYLLFKYLNGGFSFTEEIIDEGYRERDGRTVAKYYVIKRTYKNGKIKIRMKTFY